MNSPHPRNVVFCLLFLWEGSERTFSLFCYRPPAPPNVGNPMRSVHHPRVSGAGPVRTASLSEKALLRGPQSHSFPSAGSGWKRGADLGIFRMHCPDLPSWSGIHPRPQKCVVSTCGVDILPGNSGGGKGCPCTNGDRGRGLFASTAIAEESIIECKGERIYRN